MSATRYTMARWHSRQELSLVNEKMWVQSPVEELRFAYESIVYYRAITTKRATRYTMAQWHSRQELSLVNEKMWG